MTSQPPKAVPAPAPPPSNRPKTLGRVALPGAPPEPVPARMINEVLYCERLMYLEWSQGEFEDNAFTAEGREIVHARVDQPRKRRGKGQSAEEGDAQAEPPPYNARSVWLSSERLGITAKIDIIEEGEDGAVVPVEYKRGRVPDLPEQAYLPERAQVCVQALLLREHGYRCDAGSIYFAADRRRVPVVLDDALVATTLTAAARARELAAAGVLPPPLVDSPKCNGCSLVGICLPDEVSMLQGAPGAEQLDRAEVADLHGPMDADPWGLVDAATNAKLRRLHPARDDRLPLYVQIQGAYVALDSERLVVRTKEGTSQARLPNTSQVCLFGNVQISTAAVRALLERAIPLFYFSYGGWFLGRTFAHDTKNIELRVAQHAQLRDPGSCLQLARGVVVSKILNCRTMLRRNSEAPDETTLIELKQLARKAGGGHFARVVIGARGECGALLLRRVLAHAERLVRWSVRLRRTKPSAASRSGQCTSVARVLISLEGSHLGRGSLRSRPVARLLSSASFRTPGARARLDGGVSPADRRLGGHWGHQHRCGHRARRSPRARLVCAHDRRPQTLHPRLRAAHGPARDPSGLRIPYQLPARARSAGAPASRRSFAGTTDISASR